MTNAPAAWDASGRSGTELETVLELGQGGMATAYLARAVGAGGFLRLVVLKRMNLELLGNPDSTRRFLAEARLAARIHHANVVGTHQVGRDAAGPFIVLDYVEGGSLDDLVVASAERGTRIPVPVLLRIALDALSGLRAVHEAEDTDGKPLGILHRDVSLQNILVGVHDGVSRLSDFGVAKSALGTSRTDQGYLVGKLFYMAPEYLRREPVGPPLDLYALGVTLWLALSDQEPWPVVSEAQLVHAIAQEGVPPIEHYVDVAPEIAAFVARACVRDPRKRFASAREMAETLETFERKCGWLATHAEVASLVRELLGEELAERREILAQLVPGARGAKTPPLASRAASNVSPLAETRREVARATPPHRRARLQSRTRPLPISPRPPEAPQRTEPLPVAKAAPARDLASPEHPGLRPRAFLLLACALAAVMFVARWLISAPPEAPPEARAFVPVAPTPLPDRPAIAVEPVAPVPLTFPSSSAAPASPANSSTASSAPTPPPPSPPRSLGPTERIRKKNPYR